MTRGRTKGQQSKIPLTTKLLMEEAALFAAVESKHPEASLYGVTDGKKVGTYLEHKFKTHLALKYEFVASSSALGIDLPELEVDIKVTSIAQPQSSCPFRSARQKIFGLGYSLLVFVYTKTDDAVTNRATLNFNQVAFIDKERTADYQMTISLQEILNRQGNVDDLVAFMRDRYLPLDETEAYSIANELLERRTINLGYLTISNALQWRLQYSPLFSRLAMLKEFTACFETL